MKKGVILQGFEWYLPSDGKHYKNLSLKVKDLAEAGFTAIWLPPAYKGQSGINDVGYGVYDLYDLGEFDQKGTISTKYGTKKDYLNLIDKLHKYDIDIYADIVFNHKMGADKTEDVNAVKNNPNNRNEVISNPEVIKAWTQFTFPGRKNKYSDFKWDASCFSGVDYDNRFKKTAIYNFVGDKWSDDVDDENGNYDYLMGADINFNEPKVVNELHTYGKWLWDETKIDGFRLDALKHIDHDFFPSWLTDLRNYTKKELFTVGEYWSNNITDLEKYLDNCHNCMSLFDVPLHFNFHNISKGNSLLDMGGILNNTLMKNRPNNAVTFVENHDTQKGQALETVVEDWFKPMAYALILLRNEGYPCIFYGDYYGIKKYNTRSFKKEIDMMIKLRQHDMSGLNHDYFDNNNIVGWTFEGDKKSNGFAVILNDGPKGTKKMSLGIKNANKVYKDIIGNVTDEILTDKNGEAVFPVKDGSYSIYVSRV